MTDVSHEDHPVDPGMVAKAAQGPGSHLEPHETGSRPSAAPEMGVEDAVIDFPKDRGPSGSHLESWSEGDVVERIATRPPTGSHLDPDLP